MSDLDAASIAAFFAAETSLTYALVPWTPPLRGHRPSPALRRAVDSLLDVGGGLLAVHLRAGVQGVPPAGRTARRALLAALRDVDVAEVHAVACEDGTLIVARVLPSPATVPPDLRVVEGADLDDLNPLAAARLSGAVTPAQLDAVDEELDADEQVLVATGAVSLERDELMPTVAGLVALGQEPDRLLGGLVARVTVDGVSQVVAGSGITLPRRVAVALAVPDGQHDIVVGLVQRALVERAWFPHAEDEALEVRRARRRVELAWPMGHGEDGVPNRAMRRLLRAVGALEGAAERPEQMAAWLRAHGGRWLGERRRGDRVAVRVVLPAPKPEGRVPNAPVRHRTKRNDPPSTAPTPPTTTDAAVTCEDTEPPLAPTTAEVAPVPAASSNSASGEREGAVLALLEDRGRVTTREFIEALGWSRSTTRDVLARMVASGRIISVAASSRSPFQAYEPACH